jgi:septal ring factor EnvC (AmiA/AmiB activator)
MAELEARIGTGQTGLAAVQRLLDEANATKAALERDLAALRTEKGEIEEKVRVLEARVNTVLAKLNEKDAELKKELADRAKTAEQSADIIARSEEAIRQLGALGAADAPPPAAPGTGAGAAGTPNAIFGGNLSAPLRELLSIMPNTAAALRF